jgi:hypothetical protein
LTLDRTDTGSTRRPTIIDIGVCTRESESEESEREIDGDGTE